MEAIWSPKRRFELDLHGAKSRKASITDTAVNVSQRTGFFDPSFYPSMERLIKSDFTATQLCGPIALRNPEDEYDMVSDTSVLNSVTRYKIPESICN
jgi:hypothetical protein